RRPRPPGAQLRGRPHEDRRLVRRLPRRDASLPAPRPGPPRISPLLPVHARSALRRTLEPSRSGPRETSRRSLGNPWRTGGRLGLERRTRAASSTSVHRAGAEVARLPGAAAPRPVGVDHADDAPDAPALRRGRLAPRLSRTLRLPPSVLRL